MIIGLLMALIFGAGAESEFTSSIPKIKKEIRQHVTEKPRKDTLLVLVKDYEKAIKKYEKEKKRNFKKLNKSSSDRNQNSSEFIAVYDNYYQSRVQLISSLIGYRLLFQQQITEEELLLVIENAILSSKKERRKDEKQEEKGEDKLNKVFRDLNEIVVKHIGDSAKVKIVTQSLFDFESSIYATVDEAHDLSVDLSRKVRQQRFENQTCTVEAGKE